MILQDIETMTDAEKLALVKAIQENVASSKAKQVSLETGQYAKLVVDAIKKIKTDLEERYSAISSDIALKAAAIRDGKDGINGTKGEKGDTGLRGLDGANGKDGYNGKDGLDGRNGNGVADARIDFDGSLVIVLDDGREINAGEVVPFDIAEKIKVIGNGGGTSQYVLDALASLQASIDSISPTLVITDTFVVSSQAAMLALTGAEKGDVAVRTDVNKTFILTASPYSTLSNWQELLTPTDVVTSVAGRQGAVTLSNTDISGLGTAATTNSTAYATAAQGTKADTALQSITSGNVTTALGFTPYNATNPNGYTSNIGTVTSVGGTGTVSGLSLSGTVTTSGNLTLGGTLSVTASNFASQTANTVLIAPNGSAGTPTFRTLLAADIPTLNQDTTGSAGSVVTTGFSIVESGGKLLFKYGATTIASMSSTGVITSATNIISNGTP
jgi:hypothetical protein